jgi:NAD(P)H-dependent FMN reductase
LLRLDTIFSLEYLILKIKKQKLIDSIGSNNASVGAVVDAIHSADVVVLATP